ncbi:MAG: hypothetical protein HQK72_11150 [Desulfamplus sp.]|nr:hypothetical protein [Desulfamplus sp.]
MNNKNADIIEEIFFELDSFFEIESNPQLIRQRFFKLISLHNQKDLYIIGALIKYVKNNADLSIEKYQCLLWFLDNCRLILTPRRQKKSKFFLKSEQFKNTPAGNYNKKFLLSQNMSRGMLWEKVYLDYIVSQIEQSNPSEKTEIQLDRKIFDTFVDGKALKKRADIYIPKIRIIVEIKSGRITYGKSTRNQIEKDAYLLQNRIIERSIWFLNYGASKRVLLDLDKYGIEFSDMGFNDFEDDGEIHEEKPLSKIRIKADEFDDTPGKEKIFYSNEKNKKTSNASVTSENREEFREYVENIIPFFFRPMIQEIENFSNLLKLGFEEMKKNENIENPELFKAINALDSKLKK